MTSIFSPTAFAGQRVLITGATGGIGTLTSKHFKAAGAELVLADLNGKALEALADELGRTGVTTLEFDATKNSDRTNLVETIANLGGVDHLVLAAGIYEEIALAEMSDDDIMRTLQINLVSTMQLVRDIEPQLQNNGSIVLFSSMAGERGSRNHSQYAASKGGLVSFGRSMAWELGERQIRVNAVTPGIIATSMTESLVAGGGDALLKSTPLQRFGEPEEVASAAVFLASEAASFITGMVMQINGGLHMA